jgi:hypothetical protein
VIQHFIAMSGLDGLKETCEVAIKKLSQIPPRIIAAGSNADEVKSMNAEASRLQRDADTALRRLETEAKASAPSVRRQLVDTVAQLKASLGKAKNDLQQANDKAGRQELLGKAGKQKRLEEDALGRMAATADKAASGSQKLAQANAVLQETSDIGVAVIDTMQSQRESLLRSTAKVSNTNSLADRAKGIMRLMQARAITNKALLLSVVFILLALIGVVAYYAFFNKKKPSS